MKVTQCAGGVIVKQGKGDGGVMTVLQQAGGTIVDRINCHHEGKVLPRKTAFHTKALNVEQHNICEKNCGYACRENRPAEMI